MKSTSFIFLVKQKNFNTGPTWLNNCVMKKCKTCQEFKPLTEFYKNRADCKSCISSKYHATKVLKGYPHYKPKDLPTERICRVCKQTLPISEFYVSKPSPNRKSPKIDTRCKTCTRDYYISNKDTILSKYVPKPRKPKQSIEVSKRKVADHIRKRRHNDPIFRLRSTIGSLIANSLSNSGFKKTSKTADILGCTFKEFVNYIESQFAEGMTWSNRHLWHLDHIVPISQAQTIGQVMLLNHYTNLRPLWAKDNQQKAAKLTEESLVHPLYKIIKSNHGED